MSGIWSRRCPACRLPPARCRAAARSIPRSADELGKRVDGLTQQLTEERGAEATKKVDELDKYLAGLAKKGELTSDGQQRIATALSGIREAVAQG